MDRLVMRARFGAWQLQAWLRAVCGLGLGWDQEGGPNAE